MRRRLKAAARGTFNAMAVVQTMRIDFSLKPPLRLLALLLVLAAEACSQQVSFHITPVVPVESVLRPGQLPFLTADEPNAISGFSTSSRRSAYPIQTINYDYGS